jgi:long-chain fatty acid transport protein
MEANMKEKWIVTLAAVGLLFATVSPLMAGGIINKSNQSADYFRSLTRHASTDAADIVAYNPAGVMKLENGLYTKLDLLFINKKYTNTVGNVYPFTGEEGTYETTSGSPVPSFFTVYKKDKWAGFFSFTVPGGGGKVEYDDGNARTVQLSAGIIAASGGSLTGINDMYLEADSFQYGFTFGGAYEISEMFSVAGGVRFIDATQTFAGYTQLNTIAMTTQKYEVDLERDATGFGYFLGLNVAPTDKINIGLSYYSNTALDFSTDVSRDDVGVVGSLGWDEDVREDLPGVLGLGVAVRPIDPLLVELNYTHYLESRAALDDSRFESSDEGDSYELGLSLTYAFHSQWRASLGYLHTNIVGMEKVSLLTEAPELDADTIGAGVVYSPIDRLDISLGYTDVNYEGVTTSDSNSSRAPVGTELEKDVWALSLGLQYHFF